MILRKFSLAMALVLSGLGLPAAWAQTYPAKPVKLILPFSAGGPTDAIARILAQRLSEQLGVQVLVENRAGGSGVPGTEAGAKALPDGYTLTFASTTNFGVLPNLRKSLPYDPRLSFAPISQVSTSPFFIVVNAAVPAKTLGELIDLAKKQPGKLNLGSPGIGTPHHLALESFKLLTGADIFHVPFNGSGKVIADLLEGRIQLTFDSAIVLLPYIKSGKVRALAVASSSRNIAMPEVPTAAEAGLRDFERATWNGVLAPAGTPKEIVAKLHKEIVAASTTAEMRDGLAKYAVDAATSAAPGDFAAHIDRELKRYAELVRRTKMTIE